MSVCFLVGPDLCDSSTTENAKTINSFNSHVIHVDTSFQFYNSV